LSGDVRIPLADAGALGDAVRTRTASSTGAAPAFARLPAGGEMLAVPVAIAGEVVAVVYADGGRTHASEARGRHTWSGVVEVLARHAARVLESVLAFRAAQAVTGWAERPGEPAAQGETPHGSPVSGEADEAARRYARLLVSEIKLYHEPEVMEGRRQRDLMSRLGGEIARARALYEERVPPPVRSNADHFNAELIRTLAGGDPSLVGLVDRIEHVEGIEHRASWVE
jgi:hypothetical protein